MEQATRMLNLVAASVLLVAGMYMQVAFEGLLSTLTRAVIGIAALTYFVLRLGLSTESPPHDSSPVPGQHP